MTMIGEVRGIDFAIGRIAAQVGGQIGARGVDGGLDVARRAVDVAVEAELKRDPGLSDRALRGHLGHVGDRAEMLLERFGDAGSHHFGAGAGKRSLDRNGGKIDLRQRRYRQLA